MIWGEEMDSLLMDINPRIRNGGYRHASMTIQYYLMVDNLHCHHQIYHRQTFRLAISRVITHRLTVMKLTSIILLSQIYLMTQMMINHRTFRPVPTQ
jgi:hypothetical protein